jgi:hypothetical protein
MTFLFNRAGPEGSNNDTTPIELPKKLNLEVFADTTSYADETPKNSVSRNQALVPKYTGSPTYELAGGVFYLNHHYKYFLYNHKAPQDQSWGRYDDTVNLTSYDKFVDPARQREAVYLAVYRQVTVATKSTEPSDTTMADEQNTATEKDMSDEEMDELAVPQENDTVAPAGSENLPGDSFDMTDLRSDLDNNMWDDPWQQQQERDQKLKELLRKEKENMQRIRELGNSNQQLQSQMNALRRKVEQMEEAEKKRQKKDESS